MTIAKLINDHALGEGKEINSDGLGFHTYADILAQSATITPSPFTIGIFGEWGTGKTSLMRLIEENVKQQKNIIPVWFNAWLYEKEEHPIIPLIGTIIQSIENNKGFLDKLADGGQTLINALRALAYGFAAKYKVSAASLVEFEGSFSAKDSIDRQDEIGKDKLLERSLYFSSFERISNLALSGDNRIIIFIDDLDRCFPDKALLLLESIKLVLSQPGFIFIMGVSRNIIESYIKYIYEKEYGIGDFPGYKYLDKIIQLPFYIPPHAERMDEFSNQLLAYLDETTKEKLSNILPVIAIALGSNPRAVVRFVNNILIDMSISESLFQEKKIEQIELEYFAISRCIQQQWPNEFNQFVGSDELCNEVSSWNWDRISDLVRSGSVEYAGLANAFFSNRQLFKLLLETKQGTNWLQNSSKRNSAIYFLQTKRKEFPAEIANLERRFSIYLSYIDDDIGYVREIAGILNKNNIDVSIEKNKIESLKLSRSVGVCISSASKASDQLMFEIEEAMNLYQKDKTFLVIPIILPGAARDMIPTAIKQFSPLDLKDGIKEELLSNLITQLKTLGYS